MSTNKEFVLTVANELMYGIAKGIRPLAMDTYPKGMFDPLKNNLYKYNDGMLKSFPVEILECKEYSNSHSLYIFYRKGFWKQAKELKILMLTKRDRDEKRIGQLLGYHEDIAGVFNE